MNWRLLDTGVRSAAENLALDEALLTARARGEAPDTLRFLRFTPAVLVGYHQAVEQEVRLDYCRAHGIDVNRRITGGGAIYFDRSQIGWEIVAGRENPAFRRPPEEIYRLLAGGAVRGLARLGVEASFRPFNDIEVRGRKISGTGGTERGGAFLFQGTLLVDFDVQTMLRALRLPAEKLQDKEVVSFKQRVTCLAEELGEAPPPEAIKAALAEGFAEALGVTLTPGGLLPAEERLLSEGLPRFRDEAWIHHVHRPPCEAPSLLAAHKAPGGLIRLVLRADATYRRAKQSFITGDFFAYPQRLVMDLEAWMKDAPLDEAGLRQRLEAFFAGREWSIPGVGVEDFLQAYLQAARKLDYPRYGLPPEAVNEVFTISRPYGEIGGAAALLLPYCAKPVWCDLRHLDMCDECGGCTVGDAYRMAKERGMIPITICNYEHLEATLHRLREEGVASFVGSCCQAFYAKHQGDFERIGLPGVLVDIDDVTCYDLGEELEAHQGVWDKEATLKLPLLERVLDHAVKKGREEPVPLQEGQGPRA